MKTMVPMVQVPRLLRGCAGIFELRRLRLLVLLLFFIGMATAIPVKATAGTFTIYGPEAFIRGTGQSTTIVKNFAINDPGLTYTLQIYNGGLEDDEFEMVSSSVITLNGVQIVGPSEFNQNASVIEKPVTLNSSNELTVELRGKPGGGATIQIVGIDNDAPTITSTVAPAANAAGWHNQDVTVSFTCNDAISGIAACSDPVTVTTEGVGQPVTGTATDLAGNTATTTETLNIDKTAPVVAVTSHADGDTLLDPSVTISGTVDDISATVTVNGSAASVTGNNFSAVLTLVDGANTITVAAIDAAGNTGTASITLTYVADTDPPVITVTGATDGQVTNLDVTPVVTVTDANPDTETITLNGSPYASGTVITADGVYTLAVTATDTAGNSANASISFTIDKTAPVITIIGVSDRQLTNLDVIPGISVTDTNLGTQTVTLNGSPYTSGTTITADGLYALAVTASDTAGNSSNTSVSFTIDKTAPVISITGIMDGQLTNLDVTPVISVTDTNLATQTITLDGLPYTSGTLITTGGTHTLAVSATDTAGNSANASISFTIDKAAPVITVTGVTDGQLTNLDVTPVITVADANLDTQTITLNGSPYTSGTAITADGLYTLAVTATDFAGNSSNQSISFTIDKTAPVVAITSYSDGDTLFDPSVTIGGTVDDASASVTVNGNAAGVVGNDFSVALTLAEGANSITVAATDAAGNTGSVSIVITYVSDVTAPVITVTSHTDGQVTNQSSQTLVGSLNEPGALTINSIPVTLDGANAFSHGPVTLVEGANIFLFEATDIAGNSSQLSIGITFDSVAPNSVDAGLVSITEVTSGTVNVSGGAGSTEANTTITVTNTTVGGSVTATTAADGTFSVDIAAADGDVLSIVSTDAAGNSSTGVDVTVDLATAGLPPDPATIAPELDSTVATTLIDSTAFLYTGPNPIQTGVVPGTIELRRVSVLRGMVFDKDNLPLPGVTISILDHPEYGSTISRADGMFDMVVNGGSQLVVEYSMDSYIPAQRNVLTTWQDYSWSEDVVLLQYDQNVTVIDFTEPMQVHRGSVSTDESGTRQATLMFPYGTTAEMVLPDGTIQPLSTLSIRATEFTVGGNGPYAMPADLPPTSGYTYAVEYSADEAVAAGAKTVRFSQPVFSYLENFIGFPTGTPIPAGYYDYEKSTWVAIDDGMVIEVLSITGGLADLDIDGSGTAADAAALAAFGITDDEREQIASLYVPGQSMWRTPLDHFSIDLNLLVWVNYAEGAIPPLVKIWDFLKGLIDNTKCSSVIEVQRQTLGENIYITGTGHSMTYKSDRVKGRKDSWYIRLPLTGDTVPPPLVGVVLEIYIAGNRYDYRFPEDIDDFTPPGPNFVFNFVWDGKDAYGRTLQGRHPAKVRIGYEYKAYYGLPTAGGRNFAGGGGGWFSGGLAPAREVITLWQDLNTEVGTVDVKELKLGGWSLNAHHFYDTKGQVLHLGTGEERDVSDITRVITTIAGKPGNLCSDGGSLADGIPATDAKLNRMFGIALGADGSIYVTQGSAMLSALQVVRKIDPDGIITTVAGNGTAGYSGDGGPATSAQLYKPEGLDIDSQGNLYIAERYNHRIRKVDTNGIITTVAGNGISGNVGNGGPAVNARISHPDSVVVDNWGNIYIGGYYGNIRKVSPDGIINNVLKSYPWFTYPIEGLAVDDQGVLYISANNNAIYRVLPDGTQQHISGNGGRYVFEYAGDGGPANNYNVRMNNQGGLDIDSEGNLFIADFGNKVIRMIDTNGIINTVVGTGFNNSPGSTYYSGENGAAINANLTRPRDVAVDSNGNLYIVDNNDCAIHKVSHPFPGFTYTDILVPSKDGSLLYKFDPFGKHLSTINTTTGAIVYGFSYDSDGFLVEIKDGDNNITTIERDAGGDLAAIVGPYGQRTTFTLDPEGYLASVTNPATETNSFVYTADGLMTSRIDARNGLHTYTYDTDGRLIRDENPVGGFWNLVRTNNSNSSYTVDMTSAEGRTYSYYSEALPNNSKWRVNTGPDGLSTGVLYSPNGTTSVTTPDGTKVVTYEKSDPRFGLQAPYIRAVTVTTPGGLSSLVSINRAVTLSDPDDPLSMTGATNTVTVNGRTSTSIYDAATATITGTTPTGRQSTTIIDAKGRVTNAQVPGLEPASFVYDTKGRMTSATSGTGANARSVSVAFNTDGYVSDITDPLLRSVGFEYDAAGRVIKKTLVDGREINFTYDAHGNMTSITPPGRPSHSSNYTPVDLGEDYTAPDVGLGSDSTTIVYNLDKQPTLVTRPDAQTIAMAYDTGGRLDTVTMPHGQVDYTYGLDTGLLTSITAPGGVLTQFGYDGSLMTSEVVTGPVSGSVEYTYNNNLQVTSRSVNGANTATFTYDNDGLLLTAGAFGITYNAQNGLLTGTTVGGVTDTLGYNTFGEMMGYTAQYSGGDVLAATYTRDKLGRVTGKIETVGGVTDTYDYTYDIAGRLTDVEKNSVNIGHYEYDQNSNRTSYAGDLGMFGATYDAQDRLLTYGTNSYTYTQNGELSSKTDASGTTTYSYDVAGNLRSATLADGTQIDYIIDGRNRRIGKKVNGVLTQGFVYSGKLNPVAELDGAGTVVATFIGNYMEKGGNTYRVISDHLGSPRLVVDVATGAVVQEITYDEFGNVLNDSNPGFQPFGFAGGVFDQHTGLTRFGARDYDPTTGRWTAKDPIGFAGGDTNLYGYVLNDPVNFVDPTGLDSSNVWGDGLTEGLSADEIYNQVLPYWISLYNYARASRISGHNMFPGEVNSPMRHCVISCMVSTNYGTWGGRVAGTANEFQGLILHDIPNLPGRLCGKSPWAFQINDLISNERGFSFANENIDESELLQHCIQRCQGESS